MAQLLHLPYQCPELGDGVFPGENTGHGIVRERLVFVGRPPSGPTEEGESFRWVVAGLTEDLGDSELCQREIETVQFGVRDGTITKYLGSGGDGGVGVGLDGRSGLKLGEGGAVGGEVLVLEGSEEGEISGLVEGVTLIGHGFQEGPEVGDGLFAGEDAEEKGVGWGGGGEVRMSGGAVEEGEGGGGVVF